MNTVTEIRAMLQNASFEEFAVLERALSADTRKGVINALETARRRLAAQKAEQERIESLYAFQEQLGGIGLLLGLDEVGRGPIAGPLTVGGVVLPREPHIPGLNDSKQIPEAKRPDIASRIRQSAIAWTIQHIEPSEIDEQGMSACLRKAFAAAIADIEAQGVEVTGILLDGNPLHLDPREINVIKGDAKCACISAASIIAKVERDSLMMRYAEMYPLYGFEQNKGYGSEQHMAAIRAHGLSPIHRRSFCHFHEQPTLF